jgi:hypothetical protein
MAVAGYCLLDRKLNEDIRKEMHVTDVIIRIKDYQTKWQEHVEDGR